MDFDFNSLTAKGWMVAVTVVAWLGRGHIQVDRENHLATITRLTALETTQATRSDVSRLYDKIEVVGEQMHASHREIMTLMLASKDDARTEAKDVRVALSTEKDAVRKRLEDTHL